MAATPCVLGWLRPFHSSTRVSTGHLGPYLSGKHQFWHLPPRGSSVKGRMCLRTCNRRGFKGRSAEDHRVRPDQATLGLQMSLTPLSKAYRASDAQAQWLPPCLELLRGSGSLGAGTWEWGDPETVASNQLPPPTHTLQDRPPTFLLQ